MSSTPAVDFGVSENEAGNIFWLTTWMTMPLCTRALNLLCMSVLHSALRIFLLYIPD